MELNPGDEFDFPEGEIERQNAQILIAEGKLILRNGVLIVPEKNFRQLKFVVPIKKQANQHSIHRYRESHLARQARYRY